MSNAARVAVGALRCVYAVIKLFPQKNKVVFLSRQSSEPSPDIRAISECLREQYPETECVVLTRMIDGWTYVFHIIRQMYNIATSRVVVLDGFCIAASVLKHKEGTKIIQMWHSSAAIKQFGYQTIDKPSGHSRQIAEVMCMHRNYDYVMAPSKATGEFFCKGFDVSEDKLRYYGLPRLSEIAADNPELRNQIREDIMPDDDRELVLYVPTFRKGKQLDVSNLISAINQERFNLVIKPHPLDHLDEGEEHVCEKYNSTELLKACDRVITDYSAMGVEASILGKPIYYYVYDIDTYREETGLNTDPLLEMPECSSKSGVELAAMMEKDYDFDALNGFRDKYIEVPVDNCAERLADFIGNIINGND